MMARRRRNLAVGSGRHSRQCLVGDGGQRLCRLGIIADSGGGHEAAIGVLSESLLGPPRRVCDIERGACGWQ